MWAPWVVLTVFGVILAFTHWFLQPPEQRPAEMGRLYVGTLMVLCSLLVTVHGRGALADQPAAGHPVADDLHGRLEARPPARAGLGPDARVHGAGDGPDRRSSAGSACSISGGTSAGRSSRPRAGRPSSQDKDPARAEQLLRAGRAAPDPDVGPRADQGGLDLHRLARQPADQGDRRRPGRQRRDRAEEPHRGGDARHGDLELRDRPRPVRPADPARPPHPGRRPAEVRDDRVPGEPGVRDRLGRRRPSTGSRAWRKEADKAGGSPSGRRASRPRPTRLRNESQATAAEGRRPRDEGRRGREGRQDRRGRGPPRRGRGPALAADAARDDLRASTGRPRAASASRSTPRSRSRIPNPRVVQTPWRDVFPIREYYTNKKLVPASYLVGSSGALKVEIRCISPTQYLGMGESDLFILKDRGNFGVNFLMGLLGIWLQAMVLTAIGVFAGTFLSWPMALLTTLAFYIAGQVAFSFFAAIAYQSLLGGGPSESLIRLVTHDNQMSDLTPTLAVVVAKTFDALAMPVLSRLAYIVPNFGALDVSNTVAEGFAVDVAADARQPPAGAGLCPAVLHRRLFHPEESRGGGMSNLTNMQRKIVFALGILFLFVAMYPYKEFLHARRRGPRPRRGDDRRGRHRQLHAQARPARRRPRHRRQRPLDEGAGPPEGPGLGQDGGDRQPDHQAPAPLPPDLDVPGLEPRLQRLGRVGRPRRQVRVDQEGDQVPPRRRGEEREVARPALGHGLDVLPQARLRRRVDHPPPPLPRRRRRVVQARPDRQARSTTTTSSSPTAGSARRSSRSTRAKSGGWSSGGQAPQGRGRPRRRPAPAQGSARRPGLPRHARPRPDPLRGRPGEGEHGRRRAAVRRRRHATSGARP